MPFFESLSEASQNMFNAVNKQYPFLADAFLKGEAKKFRKYVIKRAKKEVGTSKDTKKNWVASKSYHKRFRIGKIYVYSENDKCIRVYNAAPHGHLVELGHRNVSRGQKRATTTQGRIEQVKTQKTSGYTEGKYVQTFAQYEFDDEFVMDAEEFLRVFIEGAIDGKYDMPNY